VNIQAPPYQLPTNDDIASLGTAPIPAGPYYRDDYFELEREAIFRRTWLQVGHVCELAEPGSFIVRPVEAAKASILITKGKDGVIRAFHNVCAHRGTQLVQEPAGNRSSFSCPYHAWTYGYDGQLRSAPDFERFYVDKAQCNLRPVAVEVCAGLIFINLDRSPKQGLSEYLGEMAEMLEALPVARATTFAEYVYEIDANWKLTYDNFQENYHLRFIHPRSAAGGFAEENPFGYPEKYGFYGQHRTQTIWFNPGAKPRPVSGFVAGKGIQFAIADGLVPAQGNKDYFAVFPNFFLLGAPTMHFSHTVTPISAGRSRGVIRIYWVGEDENATERYVRESVLASTRDVHAEDRAVIEAGQRGLESGALEHIHFQSQEVLCRHLFNAVDAAVQAYKAERDAAAALG
jgi:phenylpropionate dioxygenase-like ring-hydroxylating dioxygenase large terminal subunit